MKNIRRLRMKKKGRICGAIGLILSLALAGGTVVYGTMFHGNTVGKAEKPFGSASTGTVFDGWIHQTGFDETKALIDESGALVNGTAAENAKYKSFSLSYASSSTVTQKTGETYKVMQAQEEYEIYTDENYTYVKGSIRTMEGRTATVEAQEYALNKSANAWFVRTNSSNLTETTDDFLLSDKAKWERMSMTGSELDELFKMLSKVFTAVSDSNPVYIDMTGEYFFDIPSEEKGTSTCRFTVGTCPTIRYFSELSKKDSPDAYETMSATFRYSNLNNTKVDIPASLEEAMK